MPADTPPTLLSRDFTSPRPRKQLTLFLAGATFFTLSTLITRRAIHRKHIWPTPRFYDFSNAPPAIPIVGSLEALEALQLATVNVVAFGVMVGGGLGWGFDVSGWEELRGRLGRGKRGEGDGDVDVGGKEGREEEEGLAEWIVGVVGGRDGVVERAREERRRRDEALQEPRKGKRRQDEALQEPRDEKRKQDGEGMGAVHETKSSGGDEHKRQGMEFTTTTAEEHYLNKDRSEKPWWRPW